MPYYADCSHIFLIVLQTVEKLLELLGILDTWIDEIPPIDQPQRFGNKAFRDWFKRLEEVGLKLDQLSLVRKGYIKN